MINRAQLEQLLITVVLIYLVFVLPIIIIITIITIIVIVYFSFSNAIFIYPWAQTSRRNEKHPVSILLLWLFMPDETLILFLNKNFCPRH